MDRKSVIKFLRCNSELPTHTAGVGPYTYTYCTVSTELVILAADMLEADAHLAMEEGVKRMANEKGMIIHEETRGSMISVELCTPDREMFWASSALRDRRKDVWDSVLSRVVEHKSFIKEPSPDA